MLSLYEVLFHRPGCPFARELRANGLFGFILKKMTGSAMKKLKNEAALFKEALLAGVKYAEGRGVVEFEATDSASDKLLYIYRLLVHDKVIQPLPEDQVAEKSLRHKIAIWYSKQLPKDHPLLK